MNKGFQVPRGNELAVTGLKALAAQFIVLHHLALYGPLTHLADPLIGPLRLWFEQYGLFAVQVFLVVGGYLSAAGMCVIREWSGPLLCQRLWARYVRLVFPFAVAMGLAIVCSLWANALSPHPATPVLASWGEAIQRFVWHVLLLHTIQGVESLSAGVWYVAIDFQLYALMAIGFWALSRLPVGPTLRFWGFPFLILIVVLLSLFSFNCQPALDAWGIYFFGSYGLGVLAYWLSQQPRKYHPGWLLVVILVLFALSQHFRVRIAVALLVATFLLVFAGRQGRLWDWVEHLSKISYAVFLVHFPVCLVLNAAVVHFYQPGPLGAVVGVLLCWLGSLVAGAGFERWIERPLRRFA